MKVLIVGGGGREHALAWKLAQSAAVTKLYCAPGNAGIAACAELVPLDPLNLQQLAAFAAAQAIDLTVVGPEGPLVAGIADLFGERGLPLLGPRREAAALEGSKVFAKQLLREAGIPTAPFEVFTDCQAAEAYVREARRPLVVKADGLASGKGVIVCRDAPEALDAVRLIMRQGAFGDAGHRIVVEEMLVGEEVSCLALADGAHVLPLAAAQDHKAIFDHDRGPNTGGMGACSPTPLVDRQMERQLVDQVLAPAVRALAERGIPFRGLLYAGLMFVDGRPQVLEFNVRFGDPETQPILLRLKDDLLPLLVAAAEGNLGGCTAAWDPRPAVCVVLSAAGYPGAYQRGKPISGLERAAEVEDTVVFHAGTARQGEAIVTAGGRVLGVTALGQTMREAVDRAYLAAGLIEFEGKYCRLDIGYKALCHGQREG